MFGSLDVIFKGGFLVPDVQELSLIPNTNKSMITIVGSAGGVKLHWQAKDFMSVSHIIYHAFPTMFYELTKKTPSS